jgi:hypothetical protein
MVVCITSIAAVQGAHLLNKLSISVTDGAVEQAQSWDCLDQLHAAYSKRLSSACTKLPFMQCAKDIGGAAKMLATTHGNALPALQQYYLRRKARGAA